MGRKHQLAQPDQGAPTPKKRKRAAPKAKNENGTPVKKKRTHNYLGPLLSANLPPMYKLQDIFNDIATKALNLSDQTFRLWLEGKIIKIGTMCSGTESPILALEEIRKSMFSRPEVFFAPLTFSRLTDTPWNNDPTRSTL